MNYIWVYQNLIGDWQPTFKFQIGDVMYLCEDSWGFIRSVYTVSELHNKNNAIKIRIPEWI